MDTYYSRVLSAERLRLCYDVAPERVKRYLEAEIEFVLDRVGASSVVLELGCGYGRALKALAAKAAKAVGIDTSRESLRMARQFVGGPPSCLLVEMDAGALGFGERRFDLVTCIQNGISAFKRDRGRLIREAMRVTRSGGVVLFSSYSDQFWQDRLEWFRIQADHGLIGEIDEEATGGGVIVCRDGFRADTVRAEEFSLLASGLGVVPEVSEVDGSSVFCEITVS